MEKQHGQSNALESMELLAIQLIRVLILPARFGTSTFPRTTASIGEGERNLSPPLPLNCCPLQIVGRYYWYLEYQVYITGQCK